MDRRAHCAPGYRGCPQINIAAEYADGNHPARKVAVAHKQELRRRLTELADAMGVDEPETFALRLATVIDGALSSGQALHAHGPVAFLQEFAQLLLPKKGRSKPPGRGDPRAGPVQSRAAGSTDSARNWPRN